MNVYYELADCIVDPKLGKYFAAYDRTETPQGWAHRSKHRNLMQYSDRVWAEDEYGVRFLKNRYESLGSARVDMKEFFWIKLKSQTV
jgi:hypothetical protein